MATIVLDLEIRTLPSVINNLGAYQHALILLRLGSLPVGRITLPVTNGWIPGEILAQAAASCLDDHFWQQWAAAELALEQSASPLTPMRPVSIAICTRDRPRDLARCLEGISRLPDDGHETLVIDSASASPETRQVAGQYSGTRYLRVDRPGLDRARNHAVRAARHEIVAFIDDDAVPDPNWLRALERNFDDPLVMAVTGLTMPLELETEAQERFETYNSFNRGFRRIVFDRKSVHPLAAGRVGAGTNMAFRREIFEKVGLFDEALDAGTPTRSGGETEMFSRLLTAGYRIVYDPAALNWHRHRRGDKELLDTIRGYGIGVYAFWTRRLFVDREPAVPWIAWGWFWRNQLPDLARTLLRRPGSIPLNMQLALLAGCIRGPAAYLKSRRLLAETQTPG